MSDVVEFLEGEADLDELKDKQEQEDEEFTTDDAVQAIVDLIERDFTNLDDQGAFSELISGLSFSENDLATNFITQLQDGEDLKDKALIAAEEAEIDNELSEEIEDADSGGVT